jgi:Domain of unknown function (DUF4394)
VSRRTIRLYTIDAGTGAATLVSPSAFTVTHGTAYGMDFNPTADRIRVVNDAEENLRINPNNGARADVPANDTDLNPAGYQVAAIAYDRVSIPTPPTVAANTTLWSIAGAGSSLVMIGGVNQTPSPNLGNVMNAQPLSQTLMSGTASSTNLDVAFGGTMFLTAVAFDTGRPGLYTVDTFATMTLIGTLPERLVSVLAELQGTVKRAQAAAYNLGLATKRLELGSGKRSLTIKPSRRLVGHPRKRVKMRLRVTATDAAGNAKVTTKTISVKP